MGYLTVQSLLDVAQRGERKLTTEERRRVVAWKISVDPGVTNTEMAEWFGVTEGAVRKDRIAIREAAANEIKEDDIALVIGDILFDFKRQIRDIEKSKEQAKLGSMPYLAHCNAAMELRLKTVKALQDLGYLPKNLGAMTVDRYEYAAIVMQDGSVDTRPVNMFDEKTQKQITANETKFLPKAKENEQVVEAEYVDSPTLPPARQVVYENISTGITSENISVDAGSKEGEAGSSNTTNATSETA